MFTMEIFKKKLSHFLFPPAPLAATSKVVAALAVSVAFFILSPTVVHVVPVAVAHVAVSITAVTVTVAVTVAIAAIVEFPGGLLNAIAANILGFTFWGCDKVGGGGGAGFGVSFVGGCCNGGGAFIFGSSHDICRALGLKCQRSTSGKRNKKGQKQSCCLHFRHLHALDLLFVCVSLQYLSEATFGSPSSICLK